MIQPNCGHVIYLKRVDRSLSSGNGPQCWDDKSQI